MQFIGMDIQEKLVRVGLISAVALYAALLVASAVRTVNDGGFRALDPSLLLGQTVVLMVLAQAISRMESEFTLTSLSILSLGMRWVFSFGCYGG